MTVGPPPASVKCTLPITRGPRASRPSIDSTTPIGTVTPANVTLDSDATAVPRTSVTSSARTDRNAPGSSAGPPRIPAGAAPTDSGVESWSFTRP